MARRKSGNRIHGWVFVDKPLGMGSTQAVALVRRVFGARKAGHAGTLDPLATGLLAVALGEATKTVPYMTDALKTYTFSVRWGEATTTCDTEGEVIATSANRPEPQDIVGILPEFTGSIAQTPPAYSAIKIDGRRAYDLARAGQPVPMQERSVVIDSLRFTGASGQDQASFEVTCGKGTYVRSLARDIVVKLGTEGHVTALRRITTGNISIDQCVTVEELETADDQERAGYLHPLETVLSHLPAVELDGASAGRVSHGNPVSVPASVQLHGCGEVLLTRAGRPLAIARLENDVASPARVFQLGD